MIHTEQDAESWTLLAANAGSAESQPAPARVLPPAVPQDGGWLRARGPAAARHLLLSQAQGARRRAAPRQRLARHRQLVLPPIELIGPHELQPPRRVARVAEQQPPGRRRQHAQDG
eukprot:CAMPEP_0196699968 /NCGR_PEP_ID=MMETSP1090-20130531/48251_1 /TAXON_ID=37098 /ORGANISM="Isochrysis sp, Strain CCMP1244" /LENGTH=115 /DNA_ID=CAMNT_0042039691 /DNA_START=71 /DNA_END=415 /DNA_ORIENTATION=+